MKLVLLPGLDGTGFLFEPLVECLSAGIEPVVLPLPNDVPLGYDELTQRIAPSLPGAGRFVLLGESFSGPLALRLAATRPAGLAGVILCASFVSNPTVLPALTRHLTGSWLFRFSPAFVQAKALLGGYSTPRLRELLRRAHRAVPADVVAQRVRSVLTVDVLPELSACPVPLAYLRGAHDHVVPARAVKKITTVNHRVRVFSIEAPHLVLQVQPQASADAITAFVASLSTA